MKSFRLLKKVILGLFLVFLSLALSAQDGLGTWNVLNVRGKWNNNWSAFLEAQLRSLQFYDQFHYYEVKGGIIRNVSSNFSIAVAAGKYMTYQAGGDFVTPLSNDEFRSWLQFQMHQPMGRVRFENRFRVEQRWTSSGYRNRFRYRFHVQSPVNGSTIGPGVFYASVWDEVFLTENAPYFERNRFFMGGGYQFAPAFTVQAGWLYQFDYRLDSHLGRDFLQITLLFELARKGREPDGTPAHAD